MKKVNNIAAWLVAGLVFFSCEKDDSVLRRQMIDEQVESRLQLYFNAEKKRCRDKILEEASMLADSILRANPVFITLDSLQRPPIPIRPAPPEFERKKDSIKIEPILPKKNSGQ